MPISKYYLTYPRTVLALFESRSCRYIKIYNNVDLYLSWVVLKCVSKCSSDRAYDFNNIVFKALTCCFIAVGALGRMLFKQTIQ